MQIITATKAGIFNPTKFYVVGEGFVLADNVGDKNIIVKRMTNECRRSINIMISFGYTINYKTV